MAVRILKRARALIGVPFRLHGREPVYGMDCVGLVAAAYCASAGIPVGYALRGGSVDAYVSMINALRLTRRRGLLRPGDVLLMNAGPQQFHLGLWTGTSLIHADAMLRRVAELPGLPPWPVIGAWHNRKRKR